MLKHIKANIVIITGEQKLLDDDIQKMQKNSKAKLCLLRSVVHKKNREKLLL